MTEKVTNFFLTYQCEGRALLEIRRVDQHKGSGFEAFIILALVLLVFSLVLAGFWHYTNHARCAKVVVLYQVLLLIGIAMTFLSVIWW